MIREDTICCDSLTSDSTLVLGASVGEHLGLATNGAAQASNGRLRIHILLVQQKLNIIWLTLWPCLLCSSRIKLSMSRSLLRSITSIISSSLCATLLLFGVDTNANGLAFCSFWICYSVRNDGAWQTLEQQMNCSSKITIFRGWKTKNSITRFLINSMKTHGSECCCRCL